MPQGFLKNMQPPAGSKSVEELAEIVKAAGIPFIVKGVMTVRGALKAHAAGAAAIIVSNHGGRVLDQCSATAEGRNLPCSRRRHESTCRRRYPQRR